MIQNSSLNSSLCSEKRWDTTEIMTTFNSNSAPANVTYSNPSTMGAPPGYSHVVEVTGPQKTIYIAGQLGLNRERQVVGEPGDFEAQCRQAFENIKAALESANAKLEHLVKVNMYFTDITTQLPIAAKIRDSMLNTKAPPVSTAVQVAQLARANLLFEIDAIAVVPLTK